MPAFQSPQEWKEHNESLAEEQMGKNGRWINLG